MNSSSDTELEIRISDLPGPPESGSEGPPMATEHKRARDEEVNTIEVGGFTLGVRTGGYTKRAKFTQSKRVKPKRRGVRKDRGGSGGSGDSGIHEVATPDPRVLDAKVQFYCYTLQNVNPLYARTRYVQRVYGKPKVVSFTQGAAPKEIRYVYPHRFTGINDEWIALNQIRYFKGDLIDWCMKIADIQGEIKRNQRHRPVLFRMNIGTLKLVRNLIDQNQQWRWAMKNLVRLWIIRKSRRRLIGDDTDMITMEPIPIEEQCSIICMKTRCRYVFSGSMLMKSMKSNLESQTAGIPDVKSPKNPFTNLPYTYGQLLEIYRILLAWCAKRGRVFPSAMSLFRESDFRPARMLKIHHRHLQYKAVLSFFLDDDVRGESFLESLEVVLDAYTYAMASYNSNIMHVDAFQAWFTKDPKNYLVLAWRRIIADYWYFEQTKNYARDHWQSELCIIRDIDHLLKASEPALRLIGRDT